MDIESCLCVNKGPATIKATFDKNVFYANETAWANVTVDNSKCNEKVQYVDFEVKQMLCLSGTGILGQTDIYDRIFDVLQNRDYSGIKAKEK